jgi:hypothetical protein
VRLKDKTGGSKSLVQTRWSGGRGDLRRVKKDIGNGARMKTMPMGLHGQLCSGGA